MCSFVCVELIIAFQKTCKHTNLKEITSLSSFWLLNSSCGHFVYLWYSLFISYIATIYLFFSLLVFVPPYELHWLLVYKMEIRTKTWIMSNFCGCSIRISFLVIQIYISSMKVLYILLNVPHSLLFLPKVRVMTSVVHVYHLLGYTHRLRVGYIFTKYPYFSKSIYFNQMDTQRYIILKKYTIS